MQIDLSGKTALATGSTDGIGFALAKGLAQSGAAVVLNGRHTAVMSIARGVAKRLAGTRVTVNSVLPGPTLSVGLKAMLERQARQNGDSVEAAGIAFVKSQRPGSILQRPTTPEEVANMVVYVCSREAAATTGAALRVDGGVVDTIA